MKPKAFFAKSARKILFIKAIIFIIYYLLLSPISQKDWLFIHPWFCFTFFFEQDNRNIAGNKKPSLNPQQWRLSIKYESFFIKIQQRLKSKHHFVMNWFFDLFAARSGNHRRASRFFL